MYVPSIGKTQVKSLSTRTETFPQGLMQILVDNPNDGFTMSNLI
jgi:hypothetical protein